VARSQCVAAGGAVTTRAEAKVGMLGAMYGATRGESGRMMPGLTRRYPRAIGLVEEAARAGERGGGGRTLGGPRGGAGRGGAPPAGPRPPGAPGPARASRRARRAARRGGVDRGTGPPP